MRHRVFGKHLGRNNKQRQQLFKSLAGNLIKNGRIVTSLAKAKAAAPYIERLVTYAKSDKTGVQRLGLNKLSDKNAWQKLVGQAADFSQNGGYTRIIKLGKRQGDNTEMAVLEWAFNIDKGLKTKEERKENGEKKKEGEKK